MNILPTFKKDNVKTEDLTLYAIVDCAHLEHTFFRNLRKESSLLYRSLYEGTVNEASAFASPVLIEIKTVNQTIIRQLQDIEKKHPAVLWFWSEKLFDPIFDDLQALIQGEREDGTKIFVRFYDPRCIEMFLEYFQAREKAAGHIQSIVGWAFGSTQKGYVYL